MGQNSNFGQAIIVGLCAACAFSFGGPVALVVMGIVLMIAMKKKD